MQSQDRPNSQSDSLPDSAKTHETVPVQLAKADAAQAENVPALRANTHQAVSELQPSISTYSVTTTRAIIQPSPLVERPKESIRSQREWLAIWWESIRPSYLALSLLPLILGSVTAWTQSISVKSPRGSFHPIAFVLTLIAVLLLQTGAQLINDYYDYLNGIDTNNSLGPGGLIQQGLVQPARVLVIGLITVGLGAVLGIFIVILIGWPVIVIGLIGVLAAYFYSGVPKGLASLALGEILCFFIFGPLITIGSYFTQTGHLDRIVYIYSISLGLLAAAFILVNNMRDVGSDAPAGKLTLASLLGVRLSRTLYVILMIGAYAPIVALGLPSHSPHLLLIVLWTLPLLAVVITTVLRTTSPASLHTAMFQTLKLETYFTLLLIVGLIVDAYLPIVAHQHWLALPF
jgi:1,4-dihydroxy-2-naphthoate polyprenyltransferase